MKSQGVEESGHSFHGDQDPYGQNGPDSEHSKYKNCTVIRRWCHERETGGEDHRP